MSQMFGAKKNSLGAVAAANMPPPPVPTVPPLSHRFAAASEEVERLERELAAAIAHGQAQENRAMVAEGLLVEARKIFEQELGRLKGELDHVLNERDRYLHDYSDINARLKAVATMLLEPLKDAPPVAAAPPTKTEVEGLKAIEQELAAPAEEAR